MSRFGFGFFEPAAKHGFEVRNFAENSFMNSIMLFFGTRVNIDKVGSKSAKSWLEGNDRFDT